MQIQQYALYISMGNDVEPQLFQSQAYGNYQLVYASGQPLALVRKIVQLNPSVMAQVEFHLLRRSTITNKTIARLISYKVCQNAYALIVEMYYQYFPQTLALQLAQGMQEGALFTEEQLLKVIDDVSLALYELNCMGIHHGCINLNTILCAKDPFTDKKAFVITDVSSTTYLLNYELALESHREHALSPKLLGFLNQRILKPNVIQSLQASDDLFSLGMVIISLVSGQPHSYFYENRFNGEFLNVQLIPDRIGKTMQLIRGKYSQKLDQKIRKLIGMQQILPISILLPGLQLNKLGTSEGQQTIHKSTQRLDQTSTVGVLAGEIVDLQKVYRRKGRTTKPLTVKNRQRQREQD